MSQLGMMVIAVGLSSYNVALFHLVNHAFYKALLFLGAGSVIHAVADNQDFRKYGGLRPFLPLTYSVMLIASLSLVAFPAELFRKSLMRGQSPNSGDTLKLLIPSYSRKAISG
jgi:NADH:ubiquinone oxidoreductase subunit 5 (subunit L)/multisubunit Na+/H+ antiporter MnhA subunit